MGMISEVFEEEFIKIRNEARQNGVKYFDVLSRDLHISVGGYPGTNHRMPVCCAVMKKMMRTGDVILRQPPKGKGATLEIRYYL